MLPFTAHLYQNILAGGKFSESDFVRFTGFGGQAAPIRWTKNGRRGAFDLNKAKQRQYITQDGKKWDLFVYEYNCEFDAVPVDEMEGINIIAETLSNLTRDEMRAALQQFNTLASAQPLDLPAMPANYPEFSEIGFLDYSDKSFVVMGNTYPIKETLKKYGGRYNPYLSHPITQENLKAWIFPASRKAVLMQVLSSQ